MSYFKLDAKALTPFLYLNFLAVEDWVFTKMINLHGMPKKIRSEYHQNIENFQMFEYEKEDLDIINYQQNIDNSMINKNNKNNKDGDDNKDNKIQQEQINKQEQLLNKLANRQDEFQLQKDIHLSRIDSLPFEDLQTYQKQLSSSSVYDKVTMKISTLVGQLSNGFHQNLPVLYPLIAIGSFSAPIVMTRTLEVYFLARAGFLLSDYYTLKYKQNTSLQIASKHYELAQGFSYLIGLGLVAYCSTVPQFRYLLANIKKMQMSKSTDLQVIEKAQQQLKNMK